VDNTFVRSYSTTVDGNGRTVQETILRPGDPGMWRTTNVRSGAVMLDRPYQPVKIEHEGRTLADEFHAALADGRGRVISQTSHELVVEQTNPIPREVLARVESLKDQASVPYYWDLDPKATAYTATFRSDGVVLRIEHYAVKQSGEKILVEQWRIVDYAIIDQMPPGLPSN
jgi:hypothetical protein